MRVVKLKTRKDLEKTGLGQQVLLCWNEFGQSAAQIWMAGYVDHDRKRCSKVVGH